MHSHTKMFSIATRRALLAQQYTRRIPARAATAGALHFSTSAPAQASPYYLNQWKSSLMDQIRTKLSKVLTLNARRPGFFQGSQVAAGASQGPEWTAEEDEVMHQSHRKALQRRFEQTSNQELLEALLDCKSKPSNVYMAGQLFDECERRRLLHTLTPTQLKSVISAVFPSEQVWRKSTSLQLPARAALGQAAVQRLHGLLRLRPVDPSTGSFNPHALLLTPLVHLAEIGHAPSWQKAWQEISAADMMDEVANINPKRLISCRLRAIMRQSEVEAMSGAAAEAAVASWDTNQHSLQMWSGQAMALLREASQKGVMESQHFGFALRTLKNAGEYKSFERLLLQYTGLNVDCPDLASLTDFGARAFKTANIHNTVILSLIGNGKFSQLLAFFETFGAHINDQFNAETFEILTKAAHERGAVLAVRHYFAQAMALMGGRCDEIVQALQQSIASGHPLLNELFERRAIVTSDLIQALTTASASRTGPASRSAALLRECIAAIDRHQAAVNSVVENYASLDAVRKYPRHTQELQNHMVRLTKLIFVAHRQAERLEGRATTLRAARLRHAIIKELETFMNEDQLKRSRGMLAGLPENHLRGVLRDLNETASERPLPENSPARNSSHILFLNQSVKQVSVTGDQAEGLDGEAEVSSLRAA